MRTQAYALVLCLIIAPMVSAKDKKKNPVAPLPAIITNAKNIFLSNGGGSNLAFDAFYAKMKEWNKYKIVGSPEEADLIIELAYRVEDKGTSVWSYTNTYSNTTQVDSAQILDPQLFLTIYDVKSKGSLWAETDHRRLARRQKNRDKETVISAGRLVDDLKSRISVPQ